MVRILLVCAFASCAVAQSPFIYNRSVLNAASYIPPTLPGGAIAQGSIFSIFGTGLGPAAGMQVSTFPLNNTFAGTSVTVTQGSTTVNAIPIYVSATQINAIMPSNAPLGVASVRVITGNPPQSNPMRVNIVPTAFGIFTATGTGLGPGILQNFISATNEPINSPTIAATPGQIMVLWGTGLGPVAADNVAPTAGNLPTQVAISVGGVPVPAANILYSGRTPCCSGVDQIVFTLPTNAPLGCWVPVYIQTAGSVVSNVVTMAITPNGGSCPQSGSPLLGAGNFGAFVSLRVTTHEDIGTLSPVDVVGDYTGAVAYQAPASNFPFNPVLSLPPSGTCTAYSVKGDLLGGDPLPGAVPAGGTALTLGSGFALSGPSGMQMIPNFLNTNPIQYLGGSISSNLFPSSLFLNPGSYNLSSLTGGTIGSFSVTGTMPQPLTWTNRSSLFTVSRSQPLNVTWSGGSGAQVFVVGFGVDLPTNSTSVFGCLAPPGATSFTVPAVFLSNFPATRANPLQSKSVIYLGNAPNTSSARALNASGLTAGYAAFQFVTGKTVFFQ
jgi:uncharacterized protein (TIGR03437 family)